MPLDHHARLARARWIELLEVVGPFTDPTRARRTRRGCIRSRATVSTRLRLLRRPDGGRLGPRPRRARLGGVDHPPRLHPLRRPGRRSGRQRHRRDRPPGVRGALLGVHLNLLGLSRLRCWPESSAEVSPPRRDARRLAVATVAAAANKEPVAFNQTAAVFKRGYFVEMGEHGHRRSATR